MEEINIEHGGVEKKNSKQGIVIGIIVFIIVAIICFVGVGLGGEGCQSKELELSNMHMEVEYNEYLGYSATITGIAKNTTSRDYSYASVEFSVYDASGNNLGTALANINNLGAGDTWRFEAMLFDFPSSRPASYKLADIITW